MFDPAIRGASWTVIRREVASSTNDLARELLEAGAVALPVVVRADRQTAGRGRGAHRWWSDAGSLTFTLGLDAAACGLRDEQVPRIALATAVAVIEALETVVPAGRLGIRWPNDIEADGRKLGGILPERVETLRGLRVAIGIGLNVGTDVDQAPPEIRDMATTVAALRGAPADPAAILRAILDRVDPTLAALAADDPALAARWSALDTLAGRVVRVALGDRILVGIARGIDPRGGLILETDRGPDVLFGGQVLRPSPVL